MTDCPSALLESHPPQSVALRCADETLRYGELCDAIACGAGALRALGVGVGDRVAWLGPNTPAMLITLFACARLHAVFLPLNWRLAAAELKAILEDASARLLLAEPGFAVPAGCPVAAPDVLAQGAPIGAAPAPPDAPLLLVYTSGSTGAPRGAVLPRRALVANAANAAYLFGLSARDHVLTVLPMFHVGGLNIQAVPALLAGAAVTLHRRFDPALFLVDVARLRPTLSLLVPAVMQALIAHPAWDVADLSSLRAVGAGSSELPHPMLRAFHERGVPVQNVYGATETGPIALGQSRDQALAVPGALGGAVPRAETRLDAQGQIMVRGPAVLTHYWQGLPALDRDGWFATGDIARRAPDGTLWFHDRIKRLIISGGENISPAELERVISAVPGVAEVAVVGRPDQRWGEVPVACIVGSASDAAVLGACADTLARFKQPRAVLRFQALPRTALGKIATDQLRRMVSA